MSRIARGVCTSQHVHREHTMCTACMVVDLHIDPTLALLAVRSQHSQQRVTCTSCQARDHHGSMWVMSKAAGKLHRLPGYHMHTECIQVSINQFNERVMKAAELGTHARHAKHTGGMRMHTCFYAHARWLTRDLTFSVTACGLMKTKAEFFGVSIIGNP
jgi:hypothetical protein